MDGALQLIPRHADISAMHYRTDLFGDADLQAKFEAEYGYPLAPPETIEQMQQMAEFFVAQGAVDYGTQFAGKEEALAGRFYELLVANGGNYFDDDLQPIFNDEAGQATAEWMQDAVRGRRHPQRHAEPALARGGRELLQRQRRLLPGVVRLVQLLPGPGQLCGGGQVRPGPRPRRSRP